MVVRFSTYCLLIYMTGLCSSAVASEQKDKVFAALHEIDIQRRRQKLVCLEQFIKSKKEEADSLLLARAQEDFNISVDKMSLDQIITSLRMRIEDDFACCLIEEYEKRKCAIEDEFNMKKMSVQRKN